MGSGSGMLDLGIIAGQRRRKTVYGQTEREAIDKLSTLQTAHDRGIDLLAPTLTVGQWLDVWLSDIKGFDGTRPRTLTLYEGLAERYVKPVIGGVRLDKLTPALCAAARYRDPQWPDRTRYPAERLDAAARVQADPECAGRCLPYGAGH